MEPVVYTAFRDELKKLGSVKLALIERLIRLGATDVPRTPRLLMKQRSPHELATLQHGVDNWWNRKVTTPLMGVAEHGLKRLPEGKVQGVARGVAKVVAEDPVGAGLTSVLPVPGIQPAYFAGKKGLERVIDRVAPLPATPPI